MSEEAPPENPVSDLLGKILSQMPIMMGPAPVSCNWQVTHISDDEGKKHVFAILSLSDGNGVHSYWLEADAMLQFAQGAQQVLQVLVMENRKINPLLVASSADAAQIAQNGFGSKRGEVNWPPPEWKL